MSYPTFSPVARDRLFLAIVHDIIYLRRNKGPRVAPLGLTAKLSCFTANITAMNRHFNSQSVKWKDYMAPDASHRPSLCGGACPGKYWIT